MATPRFIRIRKLGILAAASLIIGSSSVLGGAAPAAEAAYGAIIEPVTGFVSSVVGNRCPGSDNHQGTDIAGGGIGGAPIHAAYAGSVTISGWHGGYGYAVELAHPAGTRAYTDI